MKFMQNFFEHDKLLFFTKLNFVAGSVLHFGNFSKNLELKNYGSKNGKDNQRYIIV